MSLWETIRNSRNVTTYSGQLTRNQLDEIVKDIYWTKKDNFKWRLVNAQGMDVVTKPTSKYKIIKR